MHIAVNARFLLSGKLEGIGWFTYEVVTRMAQQHPDWTFTLLFDRPFDPTFVKMPNVQGMVVGLPARHPFLWWLWFEISVPSALKKINADVFFSPDNYTSLSSNIPSLMVCHDLAYLHYPKQIPWLSRQFYRYFNPRYLAKAQHITTVSHFVKEDIEQQLGIAASKITVTYNGVRTGFSPLPKAEQAAIRAKYSHRQPYFFYVGAVHPRKNLARLIEAFNLFKSKTGLPHQLLISGRLAWQNTALKQAFETSSFSSSIHLLGFIKESELSPLLASATALTYVSLFEGFGLPILEAYQCHTPVITSQVSSMPEVAGEGAWLVNPNDALSIAITMEQLLLNDALRLERIQKGILQVAKFDWEETARLTAVRLKALGD